MDYGVLLLSLGLDLVAITVLTYAIYYRRHHRRDLTLGFMGVNTGLFAVASFVSTRPVGLAFGIGLFALLSVIRLRSTLISQEEIGYYFVAIVMGLVTGLSPDEHWGTTITLTVVLVGVMFVVDHPRVLRKYRRRVVRVKSIYRDEDELREMLANKLGGTVVSLNVLEVDLLAKRMEVDVRFVPDPPGTHLRKVDRAEAGDRDGAGTTAEAPAEGGVEPDGGNDQAAGPGDGPGDGGPPGAPPSPFLP